MRGACAVFVPILLLSACALGPSFEPPQPELPQRWSASSGEQWSGLIQHGDLDSKWWLQFGDPQLAELIERARNNNLDLRRAMLRVAQSRARREAIAGQRVPTLTASGSHRRQRLSEHGTGTRLVDAIGVSADRDAIIEVLSEPHGVYQAGFDATWELDLWGRVRRALESADASLQASTAELHAVRLSVTAEVARSYVELRGVQDQLRIAQDDIAAAEQLLELARMRAQGGLVTQLDVIAQQARLAESKARIPELEQRETELIDALSFLLGDAPGAVRAELKAAQSHPSAPAALIVSVPSELARRRPDIRAAEARLHAATAEIGVAVADLYPRIALSGGLLVEALRADDLSEWGARQWAVGPSLTLPIFDGGRRRAQVELRELQQQEAAVLYQRTVLNAWHEIATTLDVYARERQRNEELAAAVEASREAYDIAMMRYRHGLTDFLIALDAQRTWLQAERALSESHTLLASRTVALYKALGGGWE